MTQPQRDPALGGSFDSASVSLREPEAALRMTDFGRGNSGALSSCFARRSSYCAWSRRPVAISGSLDESNSQAKCLDEQQRDPALEGSFDSASVSLCETEAALRMTDFGMGNSGALSSCFARRSSYCALRMTGLGFARYAPAPQHFLYFLPEPQGQGSLRPILAVPRTTCCTDCRSPDPAMRACSSSRRFLR